MPRSLSPARTTVLLSAVLGLVVGTGGPAAAAPQDDDLIVLPGASSAEGIAQGRGATFYAGDLFRGDVFRGDLEERTAELFIDVPDGRMAVGMDTDSRHRLLFVAGGPGAAYVYDTRTGETVATYRFGDPAESFVNDVTVTREGAWFTDSRQAQLYFVPIGPRREPGEARTLALTGPAADTSGEFNLNGIAATRSGETLVVAHSGNGALYTVDPETGASALVEGVSVPNADGLVLDGRRLWVVRNPENLVVEVRLGRDLTSGEVREVITDERFQSPATAIRYEGELAVVNAKFDTGIPPTADQYEVVLVDD
ncbi:SMP-30/gluconolactonase/LRE family protein [Geodermatophilus sp. SYSU D00742]